MKPTPKKKAPRPRMVPNHVLAPFADFPKEEVGSHTFVRTGMSAEDTAAMIPGARAVLGPDGHAAILAPEPGELEAREQVRLSTELLKGVLAKTTPANLGKVLLATLDNLNESWDWLVKSKDGELVNSTKKLLELQAAMRSQDFSRRAKRRTEVNPAAKAKADAKRDAEVMWNQWMDTKPKHTWRNEDFAIEALRAWPGKFASIGVVVGWIPKWKKARTAKIESAG